LNFEKSEMIGYEDLPWLGTANQNPAMLVFI